MKKEFYAEGKQFNRLLNKLKNSDFNEWCELVIYMKEHGEEHFEHENTTIYVYQDDGLYQICIIYKC